MSSTSGFYYGADPSGRPRRLSTPSAPLDDAHVSLYPSFSPDPYSGGISGSSRSLPTPPSAMQQQYQYQQPPPPHPYQQPQYGGAVGGSIPAPIYPTVGSSPAQLGGFSAQPAAGYGYNPSASPPRSSFVAPSPAPQQPQPAASAPPTLHGGYGPVQAVSAPPVDPTVVPGSPSSVVELRFRCKGLKKADLLSQSDPFLVLYLQDQNARGWREIGRTETVRNTADPSFTTAFQLDFLFEELQRLRVEAFDRDSASESLSAHDFLGCVELTMGQLMAAQGQAKVLALLRDDSRGRRHAHGVSGHVVISAEEVSTCADRLRVRFAGSKLDNKDGWFGASDPFLSIYRLRDASSDPSSPSAAWVHVWKSEVVMDNLNPRWKQVTLSVQTLCNGDLSRTLKLECMDWEKNGKHQLIGSALVKAGELVAGEARRLELINRERQLRKGKRYKNSGVLLVEEVECFREHTFAEFLRGGCEVSLIVGIDYTASNGAPSDPASLHYVGAAQYGQQNDYQAAISAAGSILEPYDSDRRFPVYGFGGMVNGAVNHCFPLTFDPYQPEVEGVSGILRAYADSFQCVRLHGPTNFAPLVTQAATIAAHFSGGEGSLKYFVLLIITDGAIMDMQQTIDALVQASYQPLSVVIVGVGNASFSSMNTLDADGKLLVDSRRVPAARDIVQFVPFNQFRSNPGRLAKETLAEIPTQLLQYFRVKNIRPRAPLERMATDRLIGNRGSSMSSSTVSVGSAPEAAASGSAPALFHPALF